MLEPREGDAFYQYIKGSLDENSVMTVSAKDKEALSGYVAILNVMIFVLNENIANFENPCHVSKEIVLTDEGAVDFRDVASYRLVYEPGHPLAETQGAEKGFVRYYSADRKTDYEARGYYLDLRDAFEKVLAEISADTGK